MHDLNILYFQLAVIQLAGLIAVAGLLVGYEGRSMIVGDSSHEYSEDIFITVIMKIVTVLAVSVSVFVGNAWLTDLHKFYPTTTVGTTVGIGLAMLTIATISALFGWKAHKVDIFSCKV